MSVVSRGVVLFIVVFFIAVFFIAVFFSVVYTIRLLTKPPSYDRLAFVVSNDTSLVPR